MTRITGTLRLRLALGSVALIVIVTAALALAGYAIVQHSLRADIDATLAGQGRAFAEPGMRGIGAPPPPALGGRDGDDRPGRGDGDHDRFTGTPNAFGRGVLLAQAVDANGEVIAQTQGVTGIGGFPAPKVAPGDARAIYRTVRIDGDQYRVLEIARAESVVQIATSLEGAHQFLDRVRSLLVPALIAAAIVMLVFSQWLARSTLKPVEKMTRTARTITSTGDLTERVEPAFHDHELVEFSASLNDMLDAISSSREQQRQFVADASHEMKTPLTSLRGNAAYLGRVHREDEQVVETVDAIERDVDRLTGLSDALTTLARLDAAPPLQLEPTDIDEIVGSIVEQAGRGHAEHEFVVTGSVGSAVVDAELLRRIVSNLVDNAAAYTPAGTSVAVELERLEGGGAPRVHIRVRDDGPGIDEADLHRAFERFYRGSSAAGTRGTGLGLAIVAQASEQLGGHATLSTPANGGLVCDVVVRDFVS